MAQLFVTEGERVAPGTPLLRLHAPEEEAARTLIEARLAEFTRRLAAHDALQHGLIPPPEAAPLLARWREQDALADAREDSATATAREAEAARASREAALDAEARALAREIGRQRALAGRGLSPEPRLEVLLREEARLAARRADLQEARAADRAALRAALLEARHARAAAREARAAEADELRLRLAETKATAQAAAARAEALILRAPEAGHVLDLRLHGPGGHLAPGEAALTLLPERPAGRIIARLPPAQAARLAPGRAARILPPEPGAAPLEARVTRIAPAALPAPGGRSGGWPAGAPARIELELELLSGQGPLPPPGTSLSLRIEAAAPGLLGRLLPAAAGRATASPRSPRPDGETDDRHP